MPELPEVETIRRGLVPRIVGKRISGVTVGDPKPFQVSAEKLETEIRDRTIQKLDRRGKYLICELEDRLLVFHLGMTGQLTFRDPGNSDSPGFLRHPLTGLQRVRQHAPDRHTHLQVHFGDGSALLFRDIRKFGKVILCNRGPREWSQLFGHLGMEPFSEEYTLGAFLACVKGRRVRVKSLLLDQRFVAGIGNIYADEALFEARIHPARRVRYLRKYEKVRLFKAIPLVLEKGIHFGGTSMRDYIDSDGQKGRNQDKLQVYGRAGKSCRRCGETLRKITISQRGTHFCPRCQRRNQAVR